jgi:hypothetical protein
MLRRQDAPCKISRRPAGPTEWRGAVGMWPSCVFDSLLALIAMWGGSANHALATFIML